MKGADKNRSDSVTRLWQSRCWFRGNRRNKARGMEQTGERRRWVFYYTRYSFRQSPSKLRIKMMKGNRRVSSLPVPRIKAMQRERSFSSGPRGQGP